MISKKIYKNRKEIINFFLPIIVAFLFLIPLPYYITTGGGVLEIEKKIIVDQEINNIGSINSAYVKQIDGKIITYLFGKIAGFEMEKINNVILEEEKRSEYEFRERLSFTNSLTIATKVAYEALDKKFKITKENLHIIYIEPYAKTDLKVKDIIISIEGIKINNFDDITKVVEDNNYKDEITLKVIRNKKEIDCYAKLIKDNNKTIMGIYVENEYVYEADPHIDFDFGTNESGPSGGLMMSLAIYNKLIDYDITKGKKIVGTGTINELGLVGEIGGIKYKLIGAVREKADVFICPKTNLEEALKEKKAHNYKIIIIGVDTFDEAISKLEMEI